MKTTNLANGYGNGNGATKLILLHPYVHKQGTSNRLWLLLLLLCFLTLAFLGTLFHTRDSISTISTLPAVVAAASASARPTIMSEAVSMALIHYASNSNNTDKMTHTDIKQIADALRQCSPPCNFLVFGLTHETLLWRALNHNGRTVFIDENRYYAAYVEEKYPEIEAYDVQYATRLSEMPELIAAAKEQAKNECRPVQNLLFSECKLGLNDLPNQLYEVDWDVILVDGPRGYWPEAPGRMAAIFTAAVLARSKKGGTPRTHVFVHDFNMKVDRITSFEFLCRENLVKWKEQMAHFVVERMDSAASHFCRSSRPPPPSAAV
ncbi:protein IRX15-LIKE-like [Andrographis paniculata]|uniref:protein IRX15-LIKE-like n=1 Tax=Andrographis paniculata TaxID=175694 RepID=UPI0021E79331|nr:protein IRX15-LIKE-like [Andrographis paniculata]